MTTHFHIHSKWREAFGQQSLDDFTSWLNGELGTVVSRGRGREVRRVEAGGELFFVKRRTGESVWKLLTMLAFGRRRISGPVREMHLVRALANAGFTVMEPVAWGGERRSAGIPKEGFLVVRQVPGRPLAELYDVATGIERLRMMKDLGELLGRLHAHGFFQHLRLKDLVASPEGSLTIIDRECGRPWPRRFTVRQAMASLARTARRTLRDGHPVGLGAAAAFLRGYRTGVSGRWQVSRKELGHLAMARFRKEMGN